MEGCFQFPTYRKVTEIEIGSFVRNCGEDRVVKGRGASKKWFCYPRYMKTAATATATTTFAAVEAIAFQTEFRFDFFKVKRRKEIGSFDNGNVRKGTDDSRYEERKGLHG